MQVRETHVLVTGAGRRIGRAIAEAFIKKGSRVSAHVNQSVEAGAELETFASQLNNGSKVQLLKANLLEVAEIEALASNAVKRFGPVDILINSAASFYRTPSGTCTEEQWNNLLDLNLKGPYFLAQACRKEMLRGVVINITDGFAKRPLPGFTPYVASKAGLVMLTKNLASEWAPQIRVNCISPGPMLKVEGFTEEQNAKAVERTLLKRYGSPQDIVEGIFFLIENEYITGMDLHIDGGRSLM